MSPWAKCSYVLETFAVLEEFGVLCGLDGVAFDDMCHLAEFIDNRRIEGFGRQPCSATFVRKVIDRLHGRNHVRHVCKTLYNADNYEEFKNVNTQACEQYNKYLKRHKAQLRHMNRSRFNLYLLNIVDLHNAALALDCVSTTSDLLHKGRRNVEQLSTTRTPGNHNIHQPSKPFGFSTHLSHALVVHALVVQR